MEINDRATLPSGRPLDSFKPSDCIRLVGGAADCYLRRLYLVAFVDERKIAVNFAYGGFREDGLFVLEPTAKVVIE